MDANNRLSNKVSRLPAMHSVVRKKTQAHPNTRPTDTGSCKAAMDQTAAQNVACTTTAMARYSPSNEFLKTLCANPLPIPVSTALQRHVSIKTLVQLNVTQNACVVVALVHKNPKATLLQVDLGYAIVDRVGSSI